MKLGFKIILLSGLSFFLFLNNSCKKDVELDYNGYVYDSLHGVLKKPVAGVDISLYTCDKTPGPGLQCSGAYTKIADGTTDAQGHFSIQKSAHQRANWDVIYLSIPGSIYSTGTGYYKKDLPTELYMNTN